MTSARTGPARGALIMARFLDEKEREVISETVLLPLSFYPVTAVQMPPDFEKAQQNLLKTKA